MRYPEVWARIEGADLGTLEAFDPQLPGGAKDRDIWAKGMALAVRSVSLSAQTTAMAGWGVVRGKPLSAQVKGAILLEVKRFLYLLAVSREGLVPSTYVAAALVQSFDACDDLVKGLGLGPLTCHPPRARLGLEKALRRTIALRAEEFGPDDPEQIWPKALSSRLQVAGWGALGVGFGLVAIGQVDDGATGLWGLPFLVFGGFLWVAEGPWPLDLPFRRSFGVSLGA